MKVTLSPTVLLATARLKARRLRPYFTEALVSLVPHESPGLGTLAVTREAVLMYDPAIIEKWGVEQTAGVLLHEIQHLLRDHHHRMAQFGADDPSLANVAADCEINDDEVLAQTPLPSEGVTPKKMNLPDGRLAEEYYRLLKQQQEEQQEQKDSQSEETKQNTNEQKQSQEPQQAKENGSKPQVGSGQCGSCAGNPNRHEAEIPKDIGRSSIDLERVRRHVAEKVKLAAEKDAGSVPNSLKVWADQQLKPAKISWQSKLSSSVRRAAAYKAGSTDYRRDRVARRQGCFVGLPSRPVLPVLRSPVPKVAVVVDTSGSMGNDELTRAVSETSAILKSCSSVQFLSSDAKVHEVRQVKKVSELANLLVGGGGTNFVPVFEALKKTEPDIVVFITDGMGPAPKTCPKEIKVVWLLVGKYRTKPYVAGDSSTRIGWGEFIEVSTEN